MTDLEISKQLALAIGWDAYIEGDDCYVVDHVKQYDREFDYRDWNVIGPIAEQYDAFPDFCDCGATWWVAGCKRNGTNAGQGADTPQKAIAMAVIQGAKP